jgi:hypothetical protein
LVFDTKGRIYIESVENRMLRRIFGVKRGEIPGGYRKVSEN